MIGGRTVWDANDLALNAIMAEWNHLAITLLESPTFAAPAPALVPMGISTSIWRAATPQCSMTMAERIKSEGARFRLVFADDNDNLIDYLVDEYLG